jgi:hypothetical protein
MTAAKVCPRKWNAPERSPAGVLIVETLSVEFVVQPFAAGGL